MFARALIRSITVCLYKLNLLYFQSLSKLLEGNVAYFSIQSTSTLALKCTFWSTRLCSSEFLLLVKTHQRSPWYVSQRSICLQLDWFLQLTNTTSCCSDVDCKCLIIYWHETGCMYFKGDARLYLYIYSSLGFVSWFYPWIQRIWHSQ